MAYIFGGNTGIRTPKEAAHLRAIAEAMAGQRRAPANIGEGLSAIGDAIASRRYRMRADRMESEGRAAYEAKYGDLLKSLISGGGGTAPAVPDAPETPGGEVPQPPDMSQAGVGSDYAATTNIATSQLPPPEDLAGDAGTSSAQDATAEQAAGQPNQMAGLSIDAEPSQQPQPGVQKVAANGFDPRMIDALSDPWIPEGQKAVLEELFKQRLKANAPRDPIKVGEGDKLIDPATGKVIYSGSEDGSLFTGKSVDAQGLNYLIAQGVISKEQAANVAAGKTVTGPNGEIIFMTPKGLAVQKPGENGGIVLTGAKVTEEMRKTKGYLRRATAADKIMATTNIEAAGKDIKDNLLSGIPLFGNYLVQEDYQQFDQAQRDFVNALLRRESGAAISSSEFQNARLQYFPQPGDKAKVLKQKAANRKNAIESLNDSSRPVPTFGEDPVPDPSEPEITPEPQPVPEGVSEEDIEYTMKLYGMTREQVLERLNAP